MEIILLRLVHIVCGVVWVGAGVFSTFFLAPTLARMGPVGGQVMAGLQKRGLFVFMPTVALLTILSGTRLMAIMSNGFEASWFNSVQGGAYAWSGLAAIVAFVLGVAISRPLGVRMQALAGELASATDDAARAAIAQSLGAARKWMSLLGLLISALLLFSAAGMAVARYLS